METGDSMGHLVEGLAHGKYSKFLKPQTRFLIKDLNLNVFRK